jgi:peptide/nickel transport system ATP-binding protein
MPPCLSVNVQAGYRGHTVLHDVRFQLERGERLGLLGTSGAGKSTLLLAILGLLPQRGGWVKGEVHIEGRNILQLKKGAARNLRGRAFALVPQSPLSALNPALSLRSHFEAAWKAHRQGDRNHLQSRITELMQRVQLPAAHEFLNRKPGQISVGQAQRCTLALALLHRPALLIADEPTSSLDPVTQAEVITLLKEISAAEDTALLFVSHDLLSVFRLCSKLAMLSAGRITEDLPLEAVPTTQDPALQTLLRSLPFPPELLLRQDRAEPRASVRTKPQVTTYTEDKLLVHSM